MSYAEDKERASLTKEQRISELEARVAHYSKQADANAQALDALAGVQRELADGLDRVSRDGNKRSLTLEEEDKALRIGRPYTPHGDVLTGLQRDASDSTFYDAVMGLEARLSEFNHSLASVVVRCDDLVLQQRLRALSIELGSILSDWPAAC